MAPLPLAPAVPPVNADTTAADRLAARHRAANLSALTRTQPRVAEVLAAPGPDVTWVFGRDGSLTAFDPGPGERWHAGCSVPLLAARAVLETLEPGTGVACFLDPRHAAQVRVALDRLQPSQALICVVPDDDGRTLTLMLHCDDFSADLTRGRLWFASGAGWAEELGRLLLEVEGLPAPTRFVRTSLTEAARIEMLIGEAQAVFSAVAAERARKIADIRDGWNRRRAGAAVREVCVIARSTWRLWDDAGDALHAALTAPDAPCDVSWRRFDPDDPTGSSPVALASAAAAADVIVAADVSRADAPNLAPISQPWVTWVTRSRIPPAQGAGPGDRLVLGDPAWRGAALAAGWPAERVGVAGWPTPAGHAAASQTSVAMPASLAIIVDTCALDAPASLANFSSHCLLWEKLRTAVLRDPFVLAEDVDGWLVRQARAEGIAPETLDVPLFVERLLLPAYHQALAAALLEAGLPLRLHGAGWSGLPRFGAYARGPVTSREELRGVAQEAAALVHAWPGVGCGHPIGSLGRPVVRHSGRRIEGFLRETRAALAGVNEPRRPEPVNPTPLDARLLLTLLASPAS